MKRIFATYPISNTASVGIVECNEECVIYIDILGNWRRAKVYTDTKRPYFKYRGKFRIHLDECITI